MVSAWQGPQSWRWNVSKLFIRNMLRFKITLNHLVLKGRKNADLFMSLPKFHCQHCSHVYCKGNVESAIQTCILGDFRTFFNWSRHMSKERLKNTTFGGIFNVVCGISLKDFSTSLECYSRLNKQVFRDSSGAYFQHGLPNFSCGRHLIS